MIIGHSSAKSGWPAVMGVAVWPWAAAWLITLTEWAAFGHGGRALEQVAHDLLNAPNLLTPLVVYAACLCVNQFLRRGLTLVSPHQHWTAGGWFAIAALAVVAALALPWGGVDAVAYQWLWAIFSGYAVLVFLAGAHTWRRNEAPYPSMSGANVQQCR